MKNETTTFASICIFCGKHYDGDLRLDLCECGGNSFTTHTANWIHQRTWQSFVNRENNGLNPLGVSGIPPRIMSTLNSKKTEVDIINPEVRLNRYEKRGPKTKKLPAKKINDLARKGLGSKAIATQLRLDGFNVSYKTIQRRLSEARN